jgi:tetratricopeptide (TPR) repeat protein
VDEALALEPDNREAGYLRCDLLLAAEAYGAALGAADALVTSDANDAMAHWRRAWALMELTRFGEGLAAIETAVRLTPDNYKFHVTRSALLSELARLEEGLGALDDARRLGCPDADFYSARAAHLAEHGEPGDSGEVLALFDRALALNPENAQVHVARGLARLTVGDWKGWTDLEWRLKYPTHSHNDFIRQTPQWQGEPLAGKRLVVYSEWDHGDTLQFVRYLRLIEDSGAAITLAVPEALRRLLAANFRSFTVTSFPGGIDVTAFDYHVSLMSLPAILGTTVETIPATVPYLSADAALVAKWRQIIGTEGFRVGVIWQGSARYKRDRYRSIPLVEYAPLAAVPGVRLVSIQALVGLDQLNAMPAGMKVEGLGAEIENNPDGIREMAGAMASLDLIISSDTGPVHLAGALGRPVWLATPRNPEFCWGGVGDDTPWYPSMRLFRQRAAGDWADVFARMARELRATVARGWQAHHVTSCAEELGWGPSQMVLEGEWSGEPEDEVGRAVACLRAADPAT